MACQEGFVYESQEPVVIGLARATAPQQRRLVPGFRTSILLDMPPSTTPGRLVPRCSSLATPTWPLPTRTEARLSQVTCNPLLAGEVLRGFLVHFCCGLSSCSPPVGVRQIC